MKLLIRAFQVVLRFFSSILWSLNLLLFLYTLLVYYLVYTLALEHWFSGMLMISLPVAWGGLVLFLIFWLVVRQFGRAVLPLLTLLLGFPFWARTLALNRSQEAQAGQQTLRVLSYNVTSFNRYDWTLGSKPDNAAPLINWVLQHPADVKCFQEFRNDSQSVVFGTTDRLRRAGYPYFAHLRWRGHTNGEGPIGVAIFSKHPIVDRGQESFSDFNGLVWADIRLGSDTVRIINIHLESMGIRVGKVLERQPVSQVKRETKDIIHSLRDGFTSRRKQIRRVEDYVRSSPYPVIVCGDFNDTPYSVAYGRLRRLLANAFEDAGRGFGFSYHRLPGFLRIDNQFYDNRFFRALDFTTHSDVPYSDHYPIEGTYVINNEK